MQWRLTIVPLAACLLTGLGQAADAPVRRALLVGINDYALPRITDLRGATNDVDMMARVLETRLGFEPANVTVLKDAQATRSAILAAIDRLVAQSGEDDTVYFHYSGHGSQAPDRNGDEADHQDETIVAQDSRTPGVPDITDDELDRRFNRLRTRHVLLVFDSCHSGTVTRSISAAIPRSIEPDTREELYAATSRAVVEVATLPHVLMTGAPSDQEALDGPVGEGFYGLFTYSLARSLNENGPDASPEVIHEGVKRELRRIQESLYMHPPEPQLEAPAELMQRPLFGAAAAAPAASAGRRAWVATQPLDAGRLRLVGGATLGAQPGAQWAVYGAAETRFDYGAALALGTVESVSGADAVLGLQPGGASPPPGARAIPVTTSVVGEAIGVRIAGVSPARAAALVATARGELALRETQAGEPFRFSVELASGSWRVQDAGGLRVLATFADGPDADVAKALVRAIRPATEALGLLALDNLASDLKLWVGVQTAAAKPAGTRSIVLVSDDPAPAYRVRRPGEPRSNQNSLVIELQTDRDAFVTVVDVDPAGAVNQLFPNAAQKPGFLPDGRVPANGLVRIPDGLAPGNNAGFYWDYSPPLGTDTVRVFAAADLQTAQTIRRLIADTAAGRQSLAALGTALTASTVRGIRLSTEEAPAALPAAPAATMSAGPATPPTSAVAPVAAVIAPALAVTPAPPAAPPAIVTSGAGEWSAASVVIRIGE